MIDAQSRLAELFDTLPDMSGFNVRFDWGTQKDLNKWLHVNKDKGRYPLVWLLTPVSDSGDEHTISGDYTLILATLNEDVSMGNRERSRRSFATVLNPLYTNVIKSLEKGSSIDFISKERTKTNFYNYSEDDVSHETTDIWDVIKLELTIGINNNCLKPINYG